MKRHSSVASWVKLSSLLLFQSIVFIPDLLQLIFAIFAYLKSITEADAARFSALSFSALFAYAIIQYKKHRNTV